MEINFKIVLDKRRAKKNNTYPLRMRVYQGGSYKTHSLGIDLREKDWDDQTQQVRALNPNHKLYNLKIATLKSKIQKSIFLSEDEERAVSPEGLIESVARSGKKNPEAKPDILAYGTLHIAKLRAAGQIGNAIVYTSTINKLKGFANKESLPFEEVNYAFIERFNATMLSDGMRPNGIALYMRTIRALFNKAIKEGVIPIGCYPFNRFQIKTERTINRTLTIGEIASIATYELPINSTIWHHRNLFLLSFCLIGMNFSDLLTLTSEDFIDGRVVFRRRKTHKVYSVLIQPQTQDILNNYLPLRSCRPKEYILPFIKYTENPVTIKKDVAQAIKNTNGYLDKLAKLCGIPKSVTTYYARYTWANVARTLGYSKDMISEALGHSYGNTVTGIYLDNYPDSAIDEMNGAVISKLLAFKGG